MTMNTLLFRGQLPTIVKSQRISIPRQNVIQSRLASSEPTRSEEVQTAFQKLKTAMAPFISGSKVLFHDYKKARDIKAQYVFSHELYQLAPRDEILHIRKTSSELKKAAPVLIAFWIPIVGYTVPFVCFAFPSILPDALKSQTQKENEMRARLSTREKISEEFLNRLTEGMKKTPGLEGLAGEIKLAEYGSPTFLENVKDEQTKDTLYKLFDSNVNELSGRSIVSFVTYLNLAKGYLPAVFYRQKLGDYLDFIRVDDHKLRKVGLDSLDEEHLRAALFDRGYDNADLTEAECRAALQRWINIPSDKLTDSLLLYNIALRKHNAQQ